MTWSGPAMRPYGHTNIITDYTTTNWNIAANSMRFLIIFYIKFFVPISRAFTSMVSERATVVRANTRLTDISGTHLILSAVVRNADIGHYKKNKKINRINIIFRVWHLFIATVLGLFHFASFRRYGVYVADGPGFLSVCFSFFVDEEKMPKQTKSIQRMR